MTVWVRVSACDVESDSVFAQIDNSTWQVLSVPYGTAWHWYKWTTATLATGSAHVFEPCHREATMKMDQVLITDDPLVPLDDGIQRLDDDQRTHRRMLEGCPGRVSEPNTTDHDIQGVVAAAEAIGAQRHWVNRASYRSVSPKKIILLALLSLGRPCFASMGWSFRKSFKIAPGVRLNLSKKGLGASFGVKGLHVGVGSGRRARLTGGVGPFRYYKTIGGAVAGHHGTQQASAVRGCVTSLVKAAAVIVLLSVAVAAIAIVLDKRVDTEYSALANGQAADAPLSLLPATNPALPSAVNTRISPGPGSAVVSSILPTSSGTPALPLSFEERVRDSQNEAMRKYPDLAKADSAFNQMFLREYQRQRLAASKRLLDVGWPLWLADQCAARIKNPRLPPITLER